MNWHDGTVGTFAKCDDNLKLGGVADTQDGYSEEPGHAGERPLRTMKMIK